MLLAAGMALANGCGREPATPTVPKPAVTPDKPEAPPLFADRTRDSGIDSTYRNGEEADHYTILETLGGGVALFDYDRDGLLDVFLAGGGRFDADKNILGHPNRLYRNEGDLKFRDVTKETGLDAPLFYSHGCAAADYDSDGWTDLLVTGYGRLVLYRNDKGRFREVTSSAGLTDPGPLHWSTSAGWADLDSDGRLDLFVGHYVDWSFKNHPPCKGYTPTQKVDVCPPERFEPLPQALYFNQGGGKFELAKDAGLVPGKALGVVLADLDDDGRVDIYVANDALPNHLYLNQDKRRFEEAGVRAGVAYDADGKPGGSMGVDVGDCDGSGRLSLFVTNYENEMHCLYRGLGKGDFRCVSRQAGITAIGLGYVGFGTGFVDTDGDGWLDLFISNGHVVRHPSSGDPRQRPVLLRNPGHGGASSSVARFMNVTASGGPYFQKSHLGRGVALGDLDNDGRVDVVISHTNAPVALLQNVAPRSRDWLGVTLRGRDGREPIGARLTLTQGGRTQTRVVKGGGSYLSTSDSRAVFALEAGDDYRLEVRWPSGTKQILEGKSLGRNRYTGVDEQEM
jgi:enediyne biosynthesis protein E4